MTPPEFYHMYDNIDIKTDFNSFSDDPNLNNYPEIMKEYLKSGKFPDFDGGGHAVTNPTDIEIITKAYWGSISLIDKHVGRMIRALEESGLRESTLVIFTTDHGEYMGAHGMMAKGGACWEEYINLPFIASCPGLIQEGCRTNGLFSFTDIVPTMLDILNIKNPEGLPVMPYDGVTQKDLFSGKKEKIRSDLTVHHTRCNLRTEVPDQHVLIKDNGWKLVYFAGDAGGLLYNLKNDPDEINNLYNLEEYSKIQSALEKELLDKIILENDIDPIIQALTADPKWADHVLKSDDCRLTD